MTNFNEKHSIQYEDGSFISDEITLSSKSAAFAELDQIMREAEYPESVAVLIRNSAGLVVWGQHGTRVLVNV